ncbi:MAG: hypothetical protein ACM359_06405, partial [Bacillota bacterium]
GQLLHFSPHYWQECAAHGLSRMRHKAQVLAQLLESHGHLTPNGVGLAGWIEKRVTAGESNRLEDLDYHGLRALIVGLEAYAWQRGVRLPA